MVEERRQHARRTPRAPLFVSLDESAPGLVLDVCEGGVALATLVPKSPDEVISLSFDLPQGKGHIEAKAEIAWTRDSGHMTGVRFVDLAGGSRSHIEEWVSARAAAVSAVAIEPAEPAEPTALTPVTETPVSPTQDESRDETVVQLRSTIGLLRPPGEDTSKKPGPWGEGLSAEAPSRYPLRLFLAVMLLSWALVFLGYRMGSTDINPSAKEARASTKAPESTSDESMTPAPIDASMGTAAPPSHPLNWTDPGVVLQVGAMKEETNADALAEILQKRNLPAFVFRRGADRLYKVAVGPYSDSEADAATKIKDDLEKQGYQPILRRWVPE